MDEWEPNDEIDWLTGKYTNKKRGLEKIQKRVGDMYREGIKRF